MRINMHAYVVKLSTFEMLKQLSCVAVAVIIL